MKMDTKGMYRRVVSTRNNVDVLVPDNGTPYIQLYILRWCIFRCVTCICLSVHVNIFTRISACTQKHMMDLPICVETPVSVFEWCLCRTGFPLIADDEGFGCFGQLLQRWDVMFPCTEPRCGATQSWVSW